MEVYHTLLVSAVLTFTSWSVCPSYIRTKRVVYGYIAGEGDRNAYDSFRYYVFLSARQPAWFWRKIGLRLSPEPRDLVCGGSLLTPFIVQTAAHCVAKDIDDPGRDVSYLQAENIWERPLYSYIGSNLISTMVVWLKPKTYVTYARSHVLGGPAEGYLGVIYDYALVVTKDKADSGILSGGSVTLAPFYARADIRNFYRETLIREYMGLHIGHGFWNVADDSETGSYIVPESSDLIRWGWRTVMNEQNCKNIMYPPSYRRLFIFNYNEEATWVCSQPINHDPRPRQFLHNTGPGDSGGPVTINEVYFGIVSGGSTGAARDIITTDSPIVNTLYENSAEDRDNFVAFYSDTVWPNPGDLSLLDFSLTSDSPPRILTHLVLIVVPTNFVLSFHFIYLL